MTEHARAILARAIVALVEVDYELRAWREEIDGLNLADAIEAWLVAA